MNVYTVNDLMMKAGEALQNRDADTLYRLIDISQDWMQTEEEREAQQSMLNAMIEACEELEV